MPQICDLKVVIRMTKIKNTYVGIIGGGSPPALPGGGGGPRPGAGGAPGAALGGCGGCLVTGGGGLRRGPFGDGGALDPPPLNKRKKSDPATLFAI